MSKRHGQAAGCIERIRQAVRQLRGKYRLGVTTSHHQTAAARKAIRDLWPVLGVEDPLPDLDGDPMIRNLKAFRAECFVALELIDDIEALIAGRNEDLAGQLLSPLFERVNVMWQCCEGLKAENERKAAAARVEAA